MPSAVDVALNTTVAGFVLPVSLLLLLLLMLATTVTAGVAPSRQAVRRVLERLPQQQLASLGDLGVLTDVGRVLKCT